MRILIYKIKGDNIHLYSNYFENYKELKIFLDNNKEKINIVGGDLE